MKLASSFLGQSGRRKIIKGGMTSIRGRKAMGIRKLRLGLSRRDAIRTVAGAGAAAVVGPFFQVTPARADKTLKILQWSHFVPGYDKWFNNTYTKEWGAKNGTAVVIDNI